MRNARHSICSHVDAYSQTKTLKDQCLKTEGCSYVLYVGIDPNSPECFLMADCVFENFGGPSDFVFIPAALGKFYEQIFTSRKVRHSRKEYFRNFSRVNLRAWSTK